MLEKLNAYKAPDIIMMAVPFFFLLIAIELFVGWRQRRQLYNLSDSINDLTLGIFSLLFQFFYAGAAVIVYILLYETVNLSALLGYELSLDSVWAWLLCFLVYDLQYYWFHRKSHEVGFIWGSHEPHHQSEEYNLSVALRQGGFQYIFSMPFYLPLAVIGFHPIMFLVNSQINTIYQFWIHTRAIGKIPVFGWLFNTPSHHRVHHGKNPKYIDRNHGGTLIIWDKIFGTFQAEEEEPVYGTVKPLASWNPIWANFQYWIHLWKLTGRARGLTEKVKVWLMPPGYKPPGAGPMTPIPEVDAASYKKFNPVAPRTWQAYGVVQFTLAMVGFLYLVTAGVNWSVEAQIGSAVYLTAQFVSVGWFLEGRPWVVHFEVARIVLGQVLLSLVLPIGGSLLAPVLAAVGLLFLIFLFAIRKSPRLETV